MPVKAFYSLFLPIAAHPFEIEKQVAIVAGQQVAIDHFVF
jgi:hypothetical protein